MLFLLLVKLNSYGGKWGGSEIKKASNSSKTLLATHLPCMPALPTPQSSRLLLSSRLNSQPNYTISMYFLYILVSYKIMQQRCVVMVDDSIISDFDYYLCSWME